MAANAQHTDVTPRTETLKVPGATLYAEVRGSGPVLLMIPGPPADAGVFTELAELLADWYTVVSYDKRGLSRSALDGDPEDVPVSTDADDAHRLLAAVTSEPAFVLGSSGGATVGLELVTRHPEKVRTFVGHEPPVVLMLPDADRWRETLREIDKIYRTHGPFAGIQRFGEAVEEGGPRSNQQPPENPTPEQAAFMERMMGNFDFFLGHVIGPVASYIPDVEALKRASTRIVIVAGEDSGQQGAARAAVELARRLGIETVSFKGGHGGFNEYATEFAELLHTILSES